MRKSEREKMEAIERLREIVKPSDTIYCIVKHVSRSGMRREIELYKVDDGQLRCLTGNAATALGWPLGHRGVKVSGCGMDMCFHTVYSLASVIFHDVEVERGPKPAASRSSVGEHETNRGYWLRSEVL